MPDLLFSPEVVNAEGSFDKLKAEAYFWWCCISCVTWCTSLAFIARIRGIYGVSGSLYSFISLEIVWFFPRRENPISISFLGFRERWWYWAFEIGVGITTPAV